MRPLAFLCALGSTAALATLAVSSVACFGGEPCYYDDTAAQLAVSPAQGVEVIDSVIRVDGRGESCGCCGGKRPSRVVAYRLDADGDGVFEHVSKAPITVSIRFDRPGVHQLHAQVEDNRGTKAQSSAQVEVLDQPTDKELLDTVFSRIQLATDERACKTRLCLWAQTRLPELTIEDIRVQDADGATTLLTVGPVRLTPTDASLGCTDLPARASLDTLEIQTKLRGAESVAEVTWYANSSCAQ